MDEQQFDVAIAGGGPSGAVAGLELARLGYRVVIIERAQFPRRKVCGEYLNCGSVNVLEELGLMSELQPQINPLRGVRLQAAGVAIELAFPQAAAGLARSTLDFALLNAARTAGVTVLNARVMDLRREGDRVIGVRMETDHGYGDIRARYTIGADGCGSIIARKLGLSLPVKTNARYAMGGHFAQPQSDLLTMNVQRGTYLAANPLPGAQANVMLVTQRAHFSHSARRPDVWFADTAKAMAADDCDYTANARIGERVAVGPLFHRVRKHTTPGVLLVGDAGGFVSPFTGQGVFIAMASARSAARVIHAVLADPTTEATALREFADRQALDRHRRSILSDFLNALAHMPQLARRVMRAVERQDDARNQLVGMFCGITPPNIVRGARVLLPLAL